MKKKILLSFFCLGALLFGKVFAEELPISKNISVKGTWELNISARVIEKETDYISIDDALKGLGYQLGWESTHGAVIVYNPKIKQNMYVYLSDNKIWDGREFIYYNSPFLINNGCAYVSGEVLSDLIKDSFTYEIETGDSKPQEDRFRRSGAVSTYNGIHVLSGYYAFESVNITDNMAIDYANAVNTIASKLPENVKVYNMAIPNSSEFYAPKEYSTNLKEKYEIIYKNLDARVTPVNIYDTLLANADDYIFFNTDHHWTHRGAYYAFKKFMEVKGVTLEYEYIDAFGRQNSKNVVGSFASLMKGTDGEALISANAELLERFIPPYEIKKDVFDDCKLQKYVATGPLINKKILAYATFLGGDVPVARLHNTHIKDGSALLIIKDSYANAFATWAACNYEYVYLVDIRCFNGANGIEEPFDIKTFHDVTGFDDLLIMSYPNTIADYVLRDYIRKLAG